MSETKINGALVSAYLASGVMPQARTAFEGVGFTPAAGQSWARLTDLPSGREPAAFGGTNPVERTGILQVDIFHPKGSGTGAVLADVDTAMAFYTPGKRIEYQGQSVLIRKAERSQLRTEDLWQSVAVSIYYTAWIFPS
jgi:hypothetical protein